MNVLGGSIRSGPSGTGSGVTGAALALLLLPLRLGQDFCLTLPFGNRASNSPSFQLQTTLLPEVPSLFHGQFISRRHLQRIERQISWERGWEMEQQDL